ncbi:RNA polymerase sigma factor [Parapusillimonas sp. JC17]|uniref:RNA polymerase sigma factor n=1 Tax=Parapusillimonas sp. JC17 TaxID=3445768 RepID=UPI003F9EF0AB
MPLALVKPQENHLADLHLAQRIAQGDRQAFIGLMRSLNQRMYRSARSILRNDADAEEAVQDAFYKAYCAMHRFHGNSALSTWLVRIVINESVHRLRKINHLAAWLEFKDEPLDGDISMETSTPLSVGGTPEQNLAGRQVRHILETRIDQLPDLFRMVFVLRAVEELSVEETAALLQIAPATVRSRYFRARRLLRESLGSMPKDALPESFSFAGDRCNRIVANVLARLDAAP